MEECKLLHAKKCDVCGGLYESGETVGGSLASGTIGFWRAYYPNPRVYDLCRKCAEPIQEAIGQALAAVVAALAALDNVSRETKKEASDDQDK